MSRANAILSLKEDEDVTTRDDVRSGDMMKPNISSAKTTICPKCGEEVPVDSSFNRVFCFRCGADLTKEVTESNSVKGLLNLVKSIDVEENTLPNVKVSSDFSIVTVTQPGFEKLELSELSGMYGISEDEIEIDEDRITLNFAPVEIQEGDETFIGYNEHFAQVTEVDHVSENCLIVGKSGFAVVFGGDLYECDDVSLFHELFEKDNINILDEVRKASIVKKMGKAVYKKVQALKKRLGKMWKVKVGKGGRIEKVRKTRKEIRAGKKAGRHLKRGKVARKRSRKIGRRLLKRMRM